jgi:hypothetical protein
MNTVNQSAPARNPTARTFTATYPNYLDGAVLSNAAHVITVTGYGEDLRFLVDGREAGLQEVEDIRALALSRGKFVREGGAPIIPTPTEPQEAPMQTQTAIQASAPATIGKVRAHKLHLLLASEGYRGDHHKLAGKILGFEVAHLRDLSEGDARRLWTALTRTGIEVAA